MFLSWYEKGADVKDYIMFDRRIITTELSGKGHLQHFHNCIEFAFVKKGEFEIIINDVPYKMKSGEFCFINSFNRHRFHYEKGVECYILLISKSFFDEINNLENIAFPTYNPYCEGFDKIIAYLDLMYSAWDRESLVMKSGIVNTVASLLCKYYPVIDKTVDMDTQNETIFDAFIYISQHCAENITVESVAREFGYNRNYFSTLFNRYTGMNFREYLNSCRLIDFNKMRHNHPEMSVSAVAQACGFDSMNTFYRAYKKHFGGEKVPY